MDFYLGTHQPHWLRIYAVPMMVSRRTLAPYRTKPLARGPWFQDSGGFTELSMYGKWETTVETYIAETRRNAEEVGNLVYCAPMDWMCEPFVLAKTGLTIRKHQGRTIKNYLTLRDKAPELPWVPVLQGWALDDYLRCVEWYGRAGVDLAALPLVGVGTICRRQGTKDGQAILGRLHADGLKLHAFGLKTDGIPLSAPFLASSDSLAWSYAARRSAPLPKCQAERQKTGKGHKNCANCARYAFQWLRNIRNLIRAQQHVSYQSAFAF